jgi:hypothetical protein
VRPDRDAAVIAEIGILVRITGIISIAKTVQRASSLLAEETNAVASDRLRGRAILGGDKPRQQHG